MALAGGGVCLGYFNFTSDEWSGDGMTEEKLVFGLEKFIYYVCF